MAATWRTSATRSAGYNFSGFFNTVTAFYGDPRTVRATLSYKF